MPHHCHLTQNEISKRNLYFFLIWFIYFWADPAVCGPFADKKKRLIDRSKIIKKNETSSKNQKKTKGAMISEMELLKNYLNPSNKKIMEA